MNSHRSSVLLWSCGLLLVVGLACETCPPTTEVTLGDDSVVTADADSGQSSQSNTTWAFFADSPVAPLAFFSPVVSRPPGFLFRGELGEDGELVRIFDNEVLVPDILGAEILLSNTRQSTARPGLAYVAESYGAETGESVGVVGCGVFYAGPFSVLTSRIEFSGTTNDLLGRSDGTLRFITEVNPIFAALSPDVGPVETVEVPAFALRELELPLP